MPQSRRMDSCPSPVRARLCDAPPETHERPPNTSLGRSRERISRSPNLQSIGPEKASSHTDKAISRAGVFCHRQRRTPEGEANGGRAAKPIMPRFLLPSLRRSAFQSPTKISARNVSLYFQRDRNGCSGPAVGEHPHHDQDDDGCDNVMLGLPVMHGEEGLVALARTL